MAPFIYINGFPGVGKLTVAKELCKLLSNAKVVDNHLLIDPAAAVFDRSAEEYQPLRRVLRRGVLQAIATAKSTSDVTFIFTDQQSSDAVGSAASRDYYDAAAVRGCPFVSVVLHCELEENLKRAAGADRGNGTNTKLTDLAIVRSIRQGEDIHHFRDELELDLDVTHLSPSEAAGKILDHIVKVSQSDAIDAKADD